MSTRKKIHFEISERKILLRIFDPFSVIFVWFLVSSIFGTEYFEISFQGFNFLLIFSLYINLFGSVFEMYNLQNAQNQLISIKNSFFTAISSVTLFILTPFYSPSLPNARFDILLFYGSAMVALLLWRLLYIEFFVSQRFIKKAILICDKSQTEELVNGIENADLHYKIVGFVNTESEKTNKLLDDYLPNIQIEQLQKLVINENITEIVVASKKSDGISPDLYNVLIQLLEKGLAIKEYHNVYEEITHRIPLQFVTNDFYKYFPFSRSNNNKIYISIIRTLDVFFSFMGLLFLLILIPIIYLINKNINKGNLFYTQERVGKNGKVFKIYKFRSMVQDAEIDGAVFASTNDNRVSSFGKILRKSRIDEVPQFINVLKGDMAIIGPRPERPVFVKEIAAQMPYYQIRHAIKPGLTGWAQVSYPYGASIEDSLIKLQYDLFYIKNRSIVLDINIISKTISTVLFYRGQ